MNEFYAEILFAANFTFDTFQAFDWCLMRKLNENVCFSWKYRVLWTCLSLSNVCDVFFFILATNFIIKHSSGPIEWNDVYDYANNDYGRRQQINE